MKIERRSGADERRILIGLITDPHVLARVAGRWQREGMLASPWANTVAGWCVKYFGKYGAAPGKNIQWVFDKWSQSGDRDKETVTLVGKFLNTVSAEYEEQAEAANSQYLLDLCGDHFNRIGLGKLKEELEQALDENEVEEAQKKLDAYRKIDLSASTGIDMMQDDAAMQQAFEQKAEPIIMRRGALGRFYGDAFERDAFISYMGPEKRGKTWYLLEDCWQAMLQRRRVAFFEVGDMSQNQIMRRWAARATMHPLRPRTVNYPKLIERTHGDPFAVVTHEERHFDAGLTWQAGNEALRRVREEKSKTDRRLVWLSCHPASSTSVADIGRICRERERDGWVPDIIIIDYADLLSPPPGYKDSRDQIDATWQRLRGLSQEFHCLVLTATQASAASYNVRTIGRTHFSNDKRKLAHTTGIIGINATGDEMAMGIRRLNWVVLREDEYVEEKCVHVATCLPFGNPAVRSCD